MTGSASHVSPSVSCSGLPRGRGPSSNVKISIAARARANRRTRIGQIFLEIPKNFGFIGNYILGQGFVLTCAEAKDILSSDLRHEDVVFPYLNGSDLNTNYDQTASRYVINFAVMPLRRQEQRLWEEANEKLQKDWIKAGIVSPDYKDSVAADYPHILNIIKDRVLPERSKSKEKTVRQKWWRHAR